MSDLRLSDVLARRGVLAPPEVVTLVVGLALDLAGRHDAGRCHGAVCPELVRFDPDGRPRLVDASPGAAIDPATDVYDVAAIGYLALGDRQPPRLVAALDAAMHDAPAERCNARDLADRVLAAGPAAPLRLPWPQDRRELTAVDFAPTRRRRRVAVVAVAAVGLAVAFGRVSGSGKPVRWSDVLADLDQARVAAITDRSVAELGRVYDPASSLLRRDAALIRALARDGLTLRGHLAALTDPTLIGRSTLSVVERPASYDLVDSHGRVVLRVRGNATRRVVVRLRLTDDGWRVVDVS